VTGDRYFPGAIDEVAVYNRALSAAEIFSRYQRNSTHLRMQLKSCSDELCINGEFIGPDGTSNTFYKNSTVGVSPLSIQNLPSTRYLQYKLYLGSNTTTFSPKISSLELKGVPANIVYENTANDCIDFTPLETDDYLPYLTKDPKYGNTENTFYAVRLTSNQRIQLFACKPETQNYIYLTLK
jgi:hypothetical protein